MPQQFLEKGTYPLCLGIHTEGEVRGTHAERIYIDVGHADERRKNSLGKCGRGVLTRDADREFSRVASVARTTVHICCGGIIRRKSAMRSACCNHNVNSLLNANTIVEMVYELNAIPQLGEVSYLYLIVADQRWVRFIVALREQLR